nr:hypothetical protein [Tanacetum cinerariifolium]
ETLIPIPSESEGIPDHMCNVPSHDNSPPLDVSKDQIEDYFESNEEFSSIDDDSFSIDNIDYVEASPPDSELVSSEVMEIVIPEVGRIKASNDNPISFYDPIISGTPSNLTPSGESDFFLEVDAFLAKKLEEKQLEEERAAKAQNWKLPVCYDDDEKSDSLDENIISGLPPFSAITPDEPVLSTEEPDNSLSMGDEHLDTIPATESDEFIKSGVENLIPIPSESEGIPDHMCDVPSIDNSPPLDVSKDQIEDFCKSNEEFSSTDDDSFSFDNIDYVEASPPDSELVSSEVMEIVIPKVGGIKASNDNPIPFYDPIISGTPPNLTPSGESDFFLEFDAFLAVEDEFTSSQFPKSYLDPKGDMLLFESFLNDDPSSDSKTKSSSTSLNSLLEETNNFNNSLPEFTTFSNALCDAEYESDSSDDQSCFNEDVLETIVSKPLCEE